MHPKQELPSLKVLKESIPKHCYEISTFKSLQFMLYDLLKIMGSMFLLYWVRTSPWYLSISIKPLQWLISLPFMVLIGFHFWCLFVIGHDCGHGTFSKKKWINSICGEICHSLFLCTPFYPWKLSHHRHHLYHNHKEKDYSHVWLPNKEWLEKKESFLFNLAYKARYITPFFNWASYLFLGQKDGGHLILFGRLWEGSKYKVLLRGYLSSLISLLSFYGWYKLLGPHFIQMYLIPWFIYGWFIFTVTYLQHHHENVKVYDNDDWNYVKGAFETIDRTYGFGIDDTHHNITDCHLVHHLFFLKIPHYHLKEAQQHLYNKLQALGQTSLYRHQRHRFFFIDIYKYFAKHWFFAESPS